MRIELEIPEEFVKHFNHDKFEDSLDRLIADANCVAGNYEKETALMLIKALKESKPAQDISKCIDHILERLEEDTNCPNCSMYCAYTAVCGFDEMRKQAKDIVSDALTEYDYTTYKFTDTVKKSSNFSATETSQSNEQKDNSLYYEGYNRALDNFLDEISKSNQGHWRTTKYVHGEAVSQTMSYDIGTIKMIVEQLKELTQLD